MATPGMGEEGMLPTVRMDDPRMKAVINQLWQQFGRMPTRTEIAEAMAFATTGAPQAPAAPGGVGQRTAPSGSIEEKLMRDAAMKLQQGPPAHMLRNRGMLPIGR